MKYVVCYLDSFGYHIEKFDDYKMAKTFQDLKESYNCFPIMTEHLNFLGF